MTHELTRDAVPDDVAASLRAMRAACRKFLDALDVDALDYELRHSQMVGSAGWRFNQALGELRGVFGLHIARLAVGYGIDLDDPLAAVLPLDPEASEDDDSFRGRWRRRG